jgi:hypothetical protein
MNFPHARKQPGSRSQRFVAAQRIQSKYLHLGCDPGTNSNETVLDFVELRLLYHYELFRSESLSFKVGAGLQYANTLLGIRQFRGTPKDDDLIQSAIVESNDTNVVLSARANWQFSQRWNASIELDGYDWGDESYLNSGISINWRATPTWDMGVGVRYIDRKIVNSELRNDLEIGDVTFRVTHGFH